MVSTSWLDALLFAFLLMLISESITDFLTGATPVLPAPLALFIVIPVVPVFAGLGMTFMSASPVYS